MHTNLKKILKRATWAVEWPTHYLDCSQPNKKSTTPTIQFLTCPYSYLLIIIVNNSFPIYIYSKPPYIPEAQGYFKAIQKNNLIGGLEIKCKNYQTYEIFFL